MARRFLDRPEITSHDVVTRAMRRTGASDFGGMTWAEPLEILTRSLDREAELTVTGRRDARITLADLLAGRARAIPPTARRPVVVVTAADDLAVTATENALCVRSGVRTLLEESFVSMTFERRWHVPSYSEWLAEADLEPWYADVARRSAALPGDVEVLGAVEFGERLELIDRLFPGALLVEVERDLDDAVETTVAECRDRRSRGAHQADPAKIERYWRWRLGLRAERRSGGRPADLTVTYAELVEEPGALAAAVAAATGGSSPPR